MEALIVTTESRLIEIVENAISKFLNPVSETPKPSNYWSEFNIYDLENAAKYLGISKSYLTKLTAIGMIPCYKSFGRLKFEKQELDEWIKLKKDLTRIYPLAAENLSKSAKNKLKN